MDRDELKRAEPIIKAADVVHLHGAWVPVATQVAALARRNSVPYVISLRGMLDEWCMRQRALKKRFYLAVRGNTYLRGAAAIHTTAQDELRQASRYFPKEQGVVIPNYLNLVPYHSLPGPAQARETFDAFKNDAPTLLFLSRIHEKKGIEHLLGAAVELAKRPGLSGLQVIIAGSGDEAYLQKMRTLTKELGVDDRVHFVGHVSGELKLSLYEAADLFVLPTSQENFGFVFFEALACGTPVVTTRGTDTWRELEDSGGARIVDQNAKAVADSVESLFAEPGKIAEMGAAARGWVLEHLSEDRVISQFESLYESVKTGGVA